MSTDTSTCRNCEQVIYWHTSKGGKKYPCDSEDRRDFHRCSGKPQSETKAPTPLAKPAPQSLEITTDERLAALESTVAALIRQVKEIGSRIPITNADVPW